MERPRESGATFSYTVLELLDQAQAQDSAEAARARASAWRFSGLLPERTSGTPAGELAQGVLPELQRLGDYVGEDGFESLRAHIRTFGTRLLTEVIEAVARYPVQARRAQDGRLVPDQPMELPLPPLLQQEAQRRRTAFSHEERVRRAALGVVFGHSQPLVATLAGGWGLEDETGENARWEQGRPSDHAVRRLYERVLRVDLPSERPLRLGSAINTSRALLDQDLEGLYRSVTAGAEWPSMNWHSASGEAHLRLRPDQDWNERPVLVLDADNPYDRARLEAMASLTGGAHLRRCRNCNLWIVPPRAGRPPQYCPGFDCAAIAQSRYQSSEYRRTYRRLQMRLRRARQRGGRDDIREAEEALERLRREGS